MYFGRFVDEIRCRFLSIVCASGASVSVKMTIGQLVEWSVFFAGYLDFRHRFEIISLVVIVFVAVYRSSSFDEPFSIAFPVLPITALVAFWTALVCDVCSWSLQKWSVLITDYGDRGIAVFIDHVAVVVSVAVYGYELGYQLFLGLFSAHFLFPGGGDDCTILSR